MVDRVSRRFRWRAGGALVPNLRGAGGVCPLHSFPISPIGNATCPRNSVSQACPLPLAALLAFPCLRIRDSRTLAFRNWSFGARGNEGTRALTATAGAEGRNRNKRPACPSLCPQGGESAHSGSISSRSCQQYHCIRGRWKKPLYIVPFILVETVPSRCRYPNHSPCWGSGKWS